MPKVLRSSREDALNPIEADQLLDACLDLLDNLVVRLPLFAGMRIGEVQHMERELQRQIDLEMLRQINKRFPGLIPGLLKLMAKYTAEDLERAVSPIKR